MTMNIFSTFDPMWFSSLYKMMFLIILMQMSAYSMYWALTNKSTMLLYLVLSYTTSQLMMSKLKLMKGLSITMSSVFVTMLMMNMFGMLPYLPSITSHISFTLSIGLPLWTLLVISGTQLSPKKVISHLLPSGTPLWLGPFLTMIELISNFIRPLTLSLRLAANMTAGHVILSLMTSFSTTLNMKTLCTVMLMSSMYITFELGICMIQAYIFCLLVSLYSNDHP